jgi:hypothetical protein
MNCLIMPIFRRAAVTAAIVLTAGGVPLLTAGLAAADVDSSISGTVWHDLNEDGVRQPDEPVIANQTIGIVGRGARSVNTDEHGQYRLDHLPPGTYTLRSNDRSMIDGTGLTIKGGKDSRFDPVTAETETITIGRGTQVTGIDAGYVTARMDLRVTQLLMCGDTDCVASNQDWADLATPPVGKELTISGGVLPEGNVAEQLGARLTLPAGLRILDRAGGMPSTVAGHTVTGRFPQRRLPGPVEFIGVRVIADAPFDLAEIRLEVTPGVYRDVNPDNNSLTRRLAATAAPATTPPHDDPTGAPVAMASDHTPLAHTGASPAGALAVGAGLLGIGVAVLLVLRRRSARR